MRKIKKALISVSDKNNLQIIGNFLSQNKVEIISTGGTQNFLKKHNISSTDITKITGNPESFGGRVKTLDFKILSAILFDRENDYLEAEKLNIEPIDLVICNFYPFKQAKQSNSSLDNLIDNIDIGGLTLVRAAAKNFKDVLVVNDPEDYSELIIELKNNKMCSSENLRKYHMIKAFNLVANYDSEIATSMTQLQNKKSLRLSFYEYETLRYGENPHQKAVIYRDFNASKGSFLLDYEKLHGRSLSYNNILDLNGALETLSGLSRKGCCIVKHNTPCGLSESTEKSMLLQLAWEGDPISSFGSVIAFNFTVDKQDLVFLHFDDFDKANRKFVEAIAAPNFTNEALHYLKNNKNIRILSFDHNYLINILKKSEIRFIPGGLLLQNSNNKKFEKLECVTQENHLNIAQKQEFIEFGLLAVRQVRSNAIIIVRHHQDGSFQVIGQGSGQPNRLNAIKLAIELAYKNLTSQSDGKQNVNNIFEESLLISEAFFPFPDSIEHCAQFGIKTIIQPGGSIQDQKVIDSCNKHGITMYFTGTRHFKH